MMSPLLREFQEKMRMDGGMSKKDWAFWNTQPVPKFDEVSKPSKTVPRGCSNLDNV